MPKHIIRRRGAPRARWVPPVEKRQSGPWYQPTPQPWPSPPVRGGTFLPTGLWGGTPRPRKRAWPRPPGTPAWQT
eukprot:385903-Lingulodinium_polyedra.AAC.1